jgi:AcrR family transcriptional regulator
MITYLKNIVKEIQHPMAEWTKRQREFIEAALEIISSQGLQGLTIRTLAAKVGVTEGAIYRHFKSKEEILASTAGIFKTSTTEILNQLLESSLSAVEKIRMFFLGRCRQFSRHRGLALVMFSDDIFKGHTELQREIHNTIHSHKKLLTEVIAAGQQQGIVADIEPEHMFIVIMGALRLLVTRWRAADFNFDLPARGESLWNSLEKLISRQWESKHKQLSKNNQ